MAQQRGLISVDDRDLKRFEKDLKAFKKRAYPFATKQTLNTAATQTQDQARRNIQRRMVVRNTFTLREVKVQKERGLNVRTQAAVVGASMKASYMLDQEFGGTKRSSKGGAVSVPGTVAAGQAATGTGTAARKRAVRKSMWHTSIKLQARKGSTTAQRNARAVNEAIKNKRKFVYIEGTGTPGIYRIGGRKSNPELRRVHLMKQSTVPIPRNPWLLPATDMVIPRIPAIYRKALKQQLIRHRLFKPR